MGKAETLLSIVLIVGPTTAVNVFSAVLCYCGFSFLF